jgi:hypothetical protein
MIHKHLPRQVHGGRERTNHKYSCATAVACNFKTGASGFNKKRSRFEEFEYAKRWNVMFQFFESLTCPFSGLCHSPTRTTASRMPPA